MPHFNDTRGPPPVRPRHCRQCGKMFEPQGATAHIRKQTKLCSQPCRDAAGAASLVRSNAKQRAKRQAERAVRNAQKAAAPPKPAQRHVAVTENRRMESMRHIVRRNAKLRREGRLPGPVPPYWRPKTRGDCAQVMRPCPFVGCRYNLAVDVSEIGSLIWRQGDEWGGMALAQDNCALDIAAESGSTLEDIARRLGVTRERVRQEETVALAKLQAVCAELTPEQEPGRSSAASMDTDYTPRALTEYVGAPEKTEMAAAGLDEGDLWLKKVWRSALAETQEP